MSLLVDLLSKTKTKETTKDVPPGLRRTVVDGTFKKKARRKVVVLSILVLIVFLAGFATIYVMETFKSSLETTIATKTHARQIVPPAPVRVEKTPNPPVPEKPASIPPLSLKDQLPAQEAHDTKQLSEQNTPKKASIVRDDLRVTQKSEKTIQQNTGKSSSSETVGTDKTQQRADKDVYLYAARNHENRGEFKQALDHYLKALEIDPSNYIVMNNVSGIYLRLQLYGEAVSYSRKALEVKANYVPALINGGIASVSLGNAPEGEGLLFKAVSIEPYSRVALFNLAVLREKEGKYDKAYENYYKLSQMRDIDGCLGAARILERQGQHSEAARFYREILTIDNASPSVKHFANQRLSQLNR